MLPLFRYLHRFVTDSHVFFALKVSCALICILIPNFFWQLTHETVALSLGIVAAAIAEPDDSILGRIKSLVLTLICFWIATFSVQLLFPYPLLFAVGLITSTFIFIMIGCLGKRYSSISFGSLLVAVYSMMGAHQAPNIWFQPIYLCSGALWYGFISLCWLKLTPNKPLREQLAQTCFSLSRYCTQKAWLFPSSHAEQTTIHQKLAVLNIDCMNSINLCEEMITRRSKNHDQELQQLRELHLLTEALHERITSSHYLYNRLKQDVHRNLVLDGFREQLNQLGTAMQQLGYATLINSKFQISPSLTWGIQALGDQLQYSHEHFPFSLKTVNALRFLQKNLFEITQLLQTYNGAQRASMTQTSIDHQKSISFSQAIDLIRQNLTLRSPLFRHASRMSLCFAIGYGVLELFHLPQGFWIILTCLFVCQSSYSATRKRLFQRIAGTCTGLILSLPLIWLMPSQNIQLILMAIAAILFFAQLRSNYSAAVIFITLYALTAFGLLGVEEASIIVPRFIDTLIGSFLSFFAVSYLWPEWQNQRIPELLAKATQQNNIYLKAVLTSLQDGAIDPLFDHKRLQAHHADSALAQAWMNMQTDPKEQRRYMHLCSALIYRNHSLLSYISALGIHQELQGTMLKNQLSTYGELLILALTESEQALSGKMNHQPIALQKLSEMPTEELMEDQKTSLIHQEMSLIGGMATEILKLSRLLRPLIQSHV